MARRLSASHALFIGAICLILFGNQMFDLSSMLQCKTCPPCYHDDHEIWSHHESHSEGTSSVSVPPVKLKAKLSVTQEIRDVLDVERHLITQEMKGYNFSNGRYKITEKSFKHLTPELGGQPMRTLVITTWRSGSTFMSELLNSHPANFYHYEPLGDYGHVQMRGERQVSEAVRRLKNLLTCNYTVLDHYLNYGRDHNRLFTHNTRLWSQCQQYPHLCWLPDFLSSFCRLFPFQSMKVVRLRLKFVEEFLEDPSLNVRVLLLIRDPRGTLQSRKHRKWCLGSPDCSKPENLCSDLVDDYDAAVQLNAKYPNRFRVIRYEDFSVEPYMGARKIFQFIGLYFHPNIKQYLDTHTKVNAGGGQTTYRNSKEAPFHWRQDLTYQEVQNIQHVCWPAMECWGYRRAIDSEHQRGFNPVGSFSLT